MAAAHAGRRCQRTRRHPARQGGRADTFARPLPGSILTRRYKGRTLQVEVLEHGFAYAGQVYRSLSAVAKAVTGQKRHHLT
jgi:hypothetical protein